MTRACNLSIEEALIDAARRYCDDKGVSLSDLAAYLLRLHLEANGVKLKLPPPFGRVSAKVAKPLPAKRKKAVGYAARK